MSSRSRRPDEDAAAQVWAQMQAFVDRYSPRHELRRRLGDGIGKGRGKVMTLLMLADGPRSLGDIAGGRRIDPPYATAIVDQLESLGLVERTPDPGDRRRKLVRLTAQGERTVAEVREIMATPPAELTALSAEELAHLGALLGRLASAAPAG